MSAHARLSASAAHRWIPCPGSVSLSAAVPVPPSSAHAEEGTQAHEYAARILMSETVELPTDDLRQHVPVYVNFCRAESTPDSTVLVEMSLTEGLQHIDPHLGGTADFVRYCPDRKDLLVADFKYGRGVIVEAENNPQLMLYALGALYGFARHNVKTVTLAVIQPRAEGEEPIKTWTAPVDVLIEFAADVKEAAARSREAIPTYNPGEKQCRWCPAKVICPALEQQTHALVASDFTALSPAPAPERLRQLLDMVPTVEARIKAIRDHAYAEIAHGRPVPGYKLVAKRATRKWVDEEAAGKKLVVELGGVAFEKPVLKSPAQVEKAVGKKEWAKYAGLAASVSSGYTLVNDSDPRPGVELISETDFTAIGGPVDAQQ